MYPLLSLKQRSPQLCAVRTADPGRGIQVETFLHKFCVKGQRAQCLCFRDLLKVWAGYIQSTRCRQERHPSVLSLFHGKDSPPHHFRVAARKTSLIPTTPESSIYLDLISIVSEHIQLLASGSFLFIFMPGAARSGGIPNS